MYVHSYISDHMCENEPCSGIKIDLSVFIIRNL